MVSLHCLSKTDFTTYGGVLYLDGKKVPDKQTFQRRTLFQGFKISGDKFRRFDFNMNTGVIQ